MKIIYLGNFDNPYSDVDEKHITYSLEKLGHEVIPINERYFYQERNRIVEEVAEGAEVFLFHKGGIKFNVALEDFIELLNHITCKKVMWFWDKVAIKEIAQNREKWVQSVIPFIEYAFLTDETWARRHNYKNVYILRQGIGDKNAHLGKYRKEYDVPIAFLGSVYGERIEWVFRLKAIFKEKFKVYNNIFGENLCDFCASAKIIVAPKYPQDDFYWSARIYKILGSGGFLIHPKLYGLKEEFEEGKHYVGYKTFEELVEKIEYYLKHDEEREKIRLAGHKHCIQNYTYTQRVKKMLEIISK